VHAEQSILFPPFRLEPQAARLWRNGEVVPLRAKTFSVLRYLAERPGRLVTRDELLRAVWPDSHGAGALPRECVHELREILQDEAGAPRFIETVGRRQGYRFIASVTTSLRPVTGESKAPELLTSPPSATDSRATFPIVGRAAELQRLEHWFGRMLEGERKLVFVTGEPGIGKTTLVDTFLAKIDGHVLIGHGQCIEQFGAGEAYLPVLEAFGRLCRGTNHDRVLAILDRHAPTWLAQMPGVVAAESLEALQRRVQGGTRERMLREMVGAVEALTAEKPLVMVLEDLQWSDPSTLDLIATLARRREPARLLVIGTYRPADVVVNSHPVGTVKQELQAHKKCEVVLLGCLSAAEVKHYLTVRFVNNRLPPELGTAIYQNTDGNPLFLVNVLDYLVSRGAIREVDETWQLHAPIDDVPGMVPDTLRELIEKQIDRLSSEGQAMLEAASLAGAEFSAAAVAEAIERTDEELEQFCDRLARRGQFLRPLEPERLTDGKLASRYGFVHALYQTVLSGRLSEARRARLHRRIGEAKQRLHGPLASEIAAELAVHFEQGGDHGNVVKYLAQAAQNALRRSAHREAIDHLTKGLRLLEAFPDNAERTENELVLQVILGAALTNSKGHGAPEVQRAYSRARQLSRRLNSAPHVFPAVWGLWSFHLVRGELRTAQGLAKQLRRLALGSKDQRLLCEAYAALGHTSVWLGEFGDGQAELERAVSFYDRKHHHWHAANYGLDGGILSTAVGAWTLAALGYPDAALRKAEQAIDLARQLAHPYSLMGALVFSSWIFHLLGDPERARERADEVIRIGRDKDFAPIFSLGLIWHGWALVEQGEGREGMAEIEQGLADWHSTGSEIAQPQLLGVLAEARGRLKQSARGLSSVAEALSAVKKTGERRYESELHRLKGQLTLQAASRAKDGHRSKRPTSVEREAEQAFRKAIEVARKQNGKLLELRAAISLAQLWKAQGRRKPARSMLAKIYDWFTEGFDTRDMRAAKSLLEDLNR